MTRTRHTEPHPLAGHTVTLPIGVTDPLRGMVVAGAQFRVEDWWDRAGSGVSWRDTGNPAAVQYGMRILGSHKIPMDDEVVYGKIDAFGHIVHASELPGVGEST